MAQMIIARYLQRYDIDRHIGKIVEVYKRRRDVAVGSIERYFPANIRFIRPEGGLFIWIELPTGISAREILNKCLEKK
jgi:aminotransferase